VLIVARSYSLNFWKLVLKSCMVL